MFYYETILRNIICIQWQNNIYSLANEYILNGKRIYITLASSIILLFPDESEYHESQESAYEHYEYGVALAELGEVECSGK